MATSLRDTVKQHLSKDPEKVIQALKRGGVNLSKAEEQDLRGGTLKFNDKELGERFNSKVMGFMGGTFKEKEFKKEEFKEKGFKKEEFQKDKFRKEEDQ